MPRILSFTTGPSDWRTFLADPVKQWRTGYSACTLAHCWEAADGFPPEVSKVLTQTTEPLLANLEPLLAVPEFKVPLPGGSRASQNDVFVLARSSAGPVCIMVEGKVNESFGPTLDEWRSDASPGKDSRLSFSFAHALHLRSTWRRYSLPAFSSGCFGNHHGRAVSRSSGHCPRPLIQRAAHGLVGLRSVRQFVRGPGHTRCGSTPSNRLAYSAVWRLGSGRLRILKS
jgi:Domain of unknown function (DUF6946)